MPAPIQDQIDAILSRLQLIDGQGLTPPVQGQIAQLTALCKGLKKTLGNVNLGYQAEMSELKKEIDAIKTAVNAALGTNIG